MRSRKYVTLPIAVIAASMLATGLGATAHAAEAPLPDAGAAVAVPAVPEAPPRVMSGFLFALRALLDGFLSADLPPAPAAPSMPGALSAPEQLPVPVPPVPEPAVPLPPVEVPAPPVPAPALPPLPVPLPAPALPPVPAPANLPALPVPPAVPAVPGAVADPAATAAGAEPASVAAAGAAPVG
jgi:hypothetical protein